MKAAGKPRRGGGLLRASLERSRQSALLRRLGTLTSGTALAQAIQLLNLVALARLYPLAEVGVYSVFAAVVATLASVALLGYEMLIPSTADEDLAAYLQAVLLLLVPIVAGLGLLAWLVGYEHAGALVLWVAGAVAQRVAEMYNVRTNRFRWISAARLTSPLVMTLLLLTIAWQQGQSVERLIAWQAAFTLALGLVWAGLTLPPAMLAQRNSPSELRRALHRAANAPLYLMPSNLLNLAAYNVPVLAIGHWFGPALAAQYAYVLRFGFGPVGLVGGTLYQVFYGFLSEAARARDRAMFDQFLRSRRHMARAAVAAALVMALAYPLFFIYVLGPEWATAGWIALVFAPFFAAMLYLTPLSVVLNVFSRQHYELKSQAYYFAISVFSFGAAVLAGDPWVGFVLFSVLGCLRYALLLRDIRRVLHEHGVIGERCDARA